VADQEELFYRPDIDAPKRERENIPDEVVESRAFKSTIEEEIGLLPEDVPDPLTAYQIKFANYGEIAKEIKKRAIFLMDKTIEGLDLYVGDAPTHILELITDLTDIRFIKPDGTRLPSTDPAYTLSSDVAKCIFRVAGAYDPKKDEKNLLDAASDLDVEGFKEEVQEMLTNKSYTERVSYGLKLLITVAKLIHVIIVHYTIGYMCGFFKGTLEFGWKKKIAGRKVGFKFKIGNAISKIIGEVEKKLLKFVGFSCSDPNTPIPPCDESGWQKINFKEVNCCSMEAIQFGDAESASEYMQVSCWQSFIKQEIDPDWAGARTVCTYANAGDDNEEIEPSDYEKAGAKVIAQYLENRPSVSNATEGSMVSPTGGENIKALSRSIETADAATVMTENVQSSILNNRDYEKTGAKGDPYDCFGLEADGEGDSPEERMMMALNEAAGQWLPNGNGVPLEGKSYFEFLGIMDTTVSSILEFADKIVSSISNLARWSSSKQLCCFVYLIVAISSIWRALITKGQWCPDMTDGEAIRNEINARWAKELRSNKDLQQFVQLLTVLKTIIDIFIKKMQREIMISGLTLPLGEMWEMIKVTIANGLSEFLDILFGPLDKVLAGLQTIPEIRHMMNNECFGFGEFLKFLLCLLGNMKWGLINQIMKVLDFVIPDLVLLQDVLLTRMRLKSLESLSDLLGTVIDLIAGLRDCYDPEVLVNEIVQAQVENEYNNAEQLVNLAGDWSSLQLFDEFSFPIMSDSSTFSPDEAAIIDAMEAGMSSQFGDFGPAAQEIVNNVLESPVLAVSNLVNEETGEMVSLGEFTVLMEDMTGVRVSEIQESMRYIFDILRGQSDDETME